MLSRVDPKLAQPQALCVCPTRELVVQNLQVLERMGRHAGITATSTAAVDFQITRRACSVAPGRAELMHHALSHAGLKLMCGLQADAHH